MPNTNLARELRMTKRRARAGSPTRVRGRLGTILCTLGYVYAEHSWSTCQFVSLPHGSAYWYQIFYLQKNGRRSPVSCGHAERFLLLPTETTGAFWRASRARFSSKG